MICKDPGKNLLKDSSADVIPFGLNKENNGPKARKPLIHSPMPKAPEMNFTAIANKHHPCKKSHDTDLIPLFGAFRPLRSLVPKAGPYLGPSVIHNPGKLSHTVSRYQASCWSKDRAVHGDARKCKKGYFRIHPPCFTSAKGKKSQSSPFLWVKHSNRALVKMKDLLTLDGEEI